MSPNSIRSSARAGLRSQKTFQAAPTTTLRIGSIRASNCVFKRGKTSSSTFRRTLQSLKAVLIALKTLLRLSLPSLTKSHANYSLSRRCLSEPSSPLSNRSHYRSQLRHSSSERRLRSSSPPWNRASSPLDSPQATRSRMRTTTKSLPSNCQARESSFKTPPGPTVAQTRRIHSI